MNETTSGSTSTPGPNLDAVRRGKFNHETVTFEVEGVVHRVCRYGFETWSKSGFCDMFTLPQGEGMTEGLTFEKPIKLEDCTNFDFESLIEVMYPLQLMKPPSLSKDQWIGVLKLSRKWDMPEVAGLAIKHLSALDLKPVEKIKLGKDYGVPSWLREGYVILVDDLSKASLAEMTPLGWETAFRILWARDEIARARDATAGTCIVKDDLRYCGFCYRNYGNTRPVNHATTQCMTCRQHCSSLGYYVPYNALVLNNTNTSDADAKKEVAKTKVAEVFEEELKVAEARNAGTPEIGNGGDHV